MHEKRRRGGNVFLITTVGLERRLSGFSQVFFWRIFTDFSFTVFYYLKIFKDLRKHVKRKICENPLNPPNLRSRQKP